MYIPYIGWDFRCVMANEKALNNIIIGKFNQLRDYNEFQFLILFFYFLIFFVVTKPLVMVSILFFFSLSLVRYLWSSYIRDQSAIKWIFNSDLLQRTITTASESKNKFNEMQPVMWRKRGGCSIYN